MHGPASRARVLIVLRIIAEAGAVELIAISPIIDRPNRRDAGDDPIGLACRGSVAVRIAGVRDHLQSVAAEHISGRHRHRMKHAQVVHLVGNVVVDDDARISVHGDLDVVGGWFPASAVAHRPRIQLAFYDEAPIVLIEVGGQAVELGATLPQRRKRLRGGLAVIAMIDCVRLIKLGEVG